MKHISQELQQFLEKASPEELSDLLAQLAETRPDTVKAIHARLQDYLKDRA